MGRRTEGRFGGVRGRTGSGQVAMVIMALESPPEAHHVQRLSCHPHGNTQLLEVILTQLLELVNVVSTWEGRDTNGRVYIYF